MKYLNCLFAAGVSLLVMSGLTACHQAANQKTVGGDTVAQSSKDTSAQDTVAGEAHKGTVPADKLIVPGKSIGQTHLSETLDSVILKLGKPDVSDDAMGKSLCTWYDKHNKTGYQLNTFSNREMGTPDEDNSRLKIIRVTSPYFETAEHLQVGSALKQINQKYALKKMLTLAKGTDTVTVYKVNDNTVFEFSKAQVCIGIAVEDPKSSGMLSYSYFFPGMKEVK